MKLKRKPINYKVMSKEREPLEAFAKRWSEKYFFEHMQTKDIDSFLASLLEDKEEPDYKNCTNDTVSDSGFCNLGLPCKDCRFYHNPNNQ